jgi:hypothetical protein
MAEASDDLERWRAFRGEFEVREAPNAFPPPTDADLDRFEAEADARLPAGYRGFIRAFGRGSLVLGRRELFIEAPGCADPAWDLRRAVERNRRLKNDWMLGERAKRLILFGNDGMGNEFGWDPLEPTDPDAPEFAVYALYRRAEEATRLAAAFREFVELCLAGGHYRREEFQGEAEGGGSAVAKVFQRARPIIG